MIPHRSTRPDVPYPELVTAPNSGTALERITAARLPFQYVLLDIRMPVVDGGEFCGLLRRRPDQAFAAGATDYATKPFDVDDLTLRLGLAAKSLGR